MTKKLEEISILASEIAKKRPMITVSDLRNTEKDGIIDAFMDTLRKTLTSAGIDFSTWGRGPHKSLEHFAHEIIAGETTLSADPGGTLARSVDLSCVDITYEDLKLVEERQVFEDGRVRIRSLSATVTEKRLPGETAEEAALRGIAEELGLTNIASLERIEVKQVVVDSPSYPGLNSNYTITRFATTIDAKSFNPEGYVERNTSDGLTAYFKWRTQKSAV